MCPMPKVLQISQQRTIMISWFFSGGKHCVLLLLLLEGRVQLLRYLKKWLDSQVEFFSSFLVSNHSFLQSNHEVCASVSDHSRCCFFTRYVQQVYLLQWLRLAAKRALLSTLGQSFHSFYPFKDFMVQNKDILVESDPNLVQEVDWIIPFQHTLAGTDSLTGDFHKFVNVYDESFHMTRLCEICHVQISIKGSISMCLSLNLFIFLYLLMHV